MNVDHRLTCRTFFWFIFRAISPMAGPAASCGQEPTQRPDDLILLADDQRADTIAALGSPLLKTPNLDRLAPRQSRPWPEPCRPFRGL